MEPMRSVFKTTLNRPVSNTDRHESRSKLHWKPAILDRWKEIKIAKMKGNAATGTKKLSARATSILRDPGSTSTRFWPGSLNPFI